MRMRVVEVISLKGVNRDFRRPRIDFPRFEGEHPRIWKEKCEKILQDVYCSTRVVGAFCHSASFMALQLTGYKPLKLSRQTIVGLSCV
jgi:hypothetical protein